MKSENSGKSWRTELVRWCWVGKCPGRCLEQLELLRGKGFSYPGGSRIYCEREKTERTATWRFAGMIGKIASFVYEDVIGYCAMLGYFQGGQKKINFVIFHFILNIILTLPDQPFKKLYPSIIFFTGQLYLRKVDRRYDSLMLSSTLLILTFSYQPDSTFYVVGLLY